MQAINVLLAVGALLCSDVVSAHKKAKLVIGGAAAGGAGAVGAGGGFLAGSHIKSLLAKHGYGGHGHEKSILLPPKHVYLKHHEPVVPHPPPVETLHAAPSFVHAAPIAIKHEAPLVHAAEHHHHHEHHGHHHHDHHHHGIEHVEIPHAAPVAHHAHFAAPAPHLHHVEEHAHGHHHVEEHAHVHHHVKKPEPLYKGNLIIKKHVPQKGHHFSIHGYQLSIGRRPKTILHKKHFLLHPSPVIVKPFFVKKHKPPTLIKAAIPVAAPVPIKAVHAAPIEEGPIVLPIKGGHGHGPSAGPWAQAPIIINEAFAAGPIAGPIAQPVIKEAAVPVAAPIMKEAVVEAAWPAPHGGHGAENHAPLIKILGPIFDAPLPVIGGHDAW